MGSPPMDAPLVPTALVLLPCLGAGSSVAGRLVARDFIQVHAMAAGIRVTQFPIPGLSASASELAGEVSVSCIIPSSQPALRFVSVR